MDIEQVFESNWFPYLFIVCAKLTDDSIYLVNTYREPDDGIYHKHVFGRWKIKYKTIDPNVASEIQGIKYNGA